MSMKIFTDSLHSIQEYLNLRPALQSLTGDPHLADLYPIDSNTIAQLPSTSYNDYGKIDQSEQQPSYFPPPGRSNLKGSRQQQISCIENGFEKRNVHFPNSSLVSDAFPCSHPFDQQPGVTSRSDSSLNCHEIVKAYISSCHRHLVRPEIKVEQQVGAFKISDGMHRVEFFSLRGERVNALQMECLEEVFRRVQFVTVEFEYCFLDDETTVALMDMLEYYDSCIKLNLSFNQHIGLRGWQALARTIKQCPCLEEVNLRYTSLNERHVAHFARVLKFQTALQCVHLENCSLTGRSLLLLSTALKVNKTIREVYLAENNLGPNDAHRLYQLIVYNTSIHLLDVRNNALGDAGLAHLCDALRHRQCLENNSLTTLVLWNNRITAMGMQHLARALCSNTTVTTLNLGCNKIGSEGVVMLKDGLMVNKTLLRLGLQSTQLDDQAAIAVAECLADNQSLLRVDLRDNSEIRVAGLLAINLALKVNITLTTLNLDKSCSIPSNASKMRQYSEQFQQHYDEIQQFCNRNRLKKLHIAKIAEDQLKLESDDRIVDSTDDTQPAVTVSVLPLDDESCIQSIDVIDDVRHLLEGMVHDVCLMTGPRRGGSRLKRDLSFTCENSFLDKYSDRIQQIQSSVPLVAVTETPVLQDESETTSESEDESLNRFWMVRSPSESLINPESELSAPKIRPTELKVLIPKPSRFTVIPSPVPSGDDAVGLPIAPPAPVRPPIVRVKRFAWGETERDVHSAVRRTVHDLVSQVVFDNSVALTQRGMLHAGRAASSCTADDDVTVQSLIRDMLAFVEYEENGQRIRFS